MRTGVVVQVRMGSRRLPGKVLADLAGEPMLARILERLARAAGVDPVGVATSTDPRDDAVAELCERRGVPCFRADDVDDVLSRFVACARAWGCDRVIRVTGDCPFVCPEAVGRLAEGLAREDADYATFDRPTLHIGIDPFSRRVLERFHAGEASAEEREHLALLVDHHPDAFRIATVPAPEGHELRPDWRLCVDLPEDLAFARAVYDAFGHAGFSTEELVALLERRPELAAMNFVAEAGGVTSGTRSAPHALAQGAGNAPIR
jgi:spore coat polysaccharide biosynthesis protein SpsF